MITKLRKIIRQHPTLVKWLLGAFLVLVIIPKSIKVLTAERLYYPNGRLKIYRERVLFDLNFGNGRRSDGLMEEYYEDGSLASRSHAYNGLDDGTGSTWSPKGLRTDHWTFDRGKPRDGQRIILYDEGNMKQIITYKGGVLDGRQATWNEKGLLTDEWYYTNGKPNDGTRKTLYDSGKPKLETTLQKGIQEGWERTWEEDGRLMAEIYFVKGDATIEIDYGENGLIDQKTEYLKSGKVIKNYANGKLVETLHFAPR